MDSDTLKFTALGTAVLGVLLALSNNSVVVVLSWLLLLAGVVALGLSIRKEGVASARSRRPAAICAAVAVTLLAFGFPFLALVRPAQRSARAAVIQAYTAEQTIKDDRERLSRLAADENVDATEAGLSRERRRNLALKEDIDALCRSLELAPAEAFQLPGAESEDRVPIFRRSLADQRKELARRARERGTEIAVKELGFPESPAPEDVPDAFLDLELVVHALERAIQARVRRITAIEPEPLTYAAHDAAPKVDVVRREVTFEVEATLTALGLWFQALQTESPFLAVNEIELPVAGRSSSSRSSDRKDSGVLGDLVRARLVVSAFYTNDGLLSGGEAAGSTEGAPPPRRWRRR